MMILLNKKFRRALFTILIFIIQMSSSKRNSPPSPLLSPLRLNKISRLLHPLLTLR